MHRHQICDAHEWINEIPTVPIYYLAKPQPRERAWQNQRGKKTLERCSNYSFYYLSGVDSGFPRREDVPEPFLCDRTGCKIAGTVNNAWRLGPHALRILTFKGLWIERLQGYRQHVFGRVDKVQSTP